MPQPFSFPPPPPPPPKRETESSENIRGGFRGRGGSRGQPSRDSGTFTRGRGSYKQNFHRGRGHLNQRPSAAAPKRDFATAFTQQSQARPKAPPAVPSFEVDIKSLLPTKPPPSAVVNAKRKNNLLGLTPSNQEDSESEDDGDDEVRMAAAVPGEGLQFEHKGQQLSLRNPEEVAAWIAERKRRYPTQAKVEVAKQEAEEKKKRWEEQKRAREETFRLKKEARENERNERDKQRLKEKAIAVQIAKAKSAVADTKEDVALKAKLKAEKLRARAERATRELQLAEEQLRKLGRPEAGSLEEEDQGSKRNNPIASDTDASSASNDEETSSSGSSGTDIDPDSGPEESTSRSTGPERVKPSKQDLRGNSDDGPPLCKNLVKFGRCKFGKKCRYSHKLPRERSRKPASTPGRRKGLYQVLVEKEQEELLKKTLRAIITLGEKGMLEEPQQADANTENVISVPAGTALGDAS